MDFTAQDVAEQLTRMDAVSSFTFMLLCRFPIPPDVVLLSFSLLFLCLLTSASACSSCVQELFVKVVPFHCVGCVWSQRDKKENRHIAPTVRATIAQFNAVTNRVITSLLCQPPVSPGSSPRCFSSSPTHRARVIEKWIAVAQVSADCLYCGKKVERSFDYLENIRGWKWEIHKCVAFEHYHEQILCSIQPD